MRLHRSALVILGLALLIFAAPLCADQKSYSYARIVRLSLVSGDVQIARSSSSEWENAAPNMPIQQGFTIGTNNGRAEVEFESGATMWIAENTVVQFTELALSDGGRITRLTLTQGTSSFQVKLRSGDAFEVNTSSFRVTVPNHTKFRVDALRDGASVSVIDGSSTVNSGSNTELVGSGRTSAIRGSAPGEFAMKANPGKDSWDNWVNDRAGIVMTGTNQSLKYTDAPFEYGLNDLSSYGNWSDCAGYGFGWQPWGMGANWAPFYNGYFDYYNGLGWTWISAEPWGWAPYHFGSWAYASGCGGWMWMPGMYGFWSPAPVAFVGTGGGNIGWRPRPVPWQNPREPVTEASTGRARVADVPIVVGAKGGIGNGLATGILTPGKSQETFEEFSGMPGRSGKIDVHDGAFRSTGKTSFAVPTSSSLAELRNGVAFDAKENRFVSGGSAPADSIRLSVLANGVHESRSVPRQPEPSGFNFSEGRGAASQGGHSTYGGTSRGSSSSGFSSGGHAGSGSSAGGGHASGGSAGGAAHTH